MTDQPKPLTDDELEEIATGRDWREATCSKCGKAMIVSPDLREVACFHPSPLSVSIGDRANDDITYTRTGPRALARLVAEVRRLRSDEWLEAALREIGRGRADGWSTGVGIPTTSDLLAILRKHRDAEPKP